MDPPTIDRLISHSRAGDSVDTWCAGPIGLAQSGMALTASVPPLIPLAERPRGVVMAWDGRIDNRSELAATAGMGALTSVSDPELVTRLYTKFGLNCVEHLVGDFALVIWDLERNRLFAARDQLGVRPLHYAVNRARCFVASRIDEIRIASGLPRVVNERTLGAFMAGRLSSSTDTFFDGVSRVPAGHFIEVGRFGVRVQRYWSPDWNRTVELERFEDYATEFERLTRQAVGSRMQSGRSAGLMLSGGLDSSAVAYAIADSQRGGGESEEPPHAFTAVFPDATLPNELARAEQVSAQCLFRSHRVDGESTWTFDETFPAAWDEPLEGMYVGAARQLLRAAQQQGVEVLLTGYGGDLVSASTYYYLFALARTRNWSRLFAELRSYSSPTRWSTVINFLVKPLLIRRVEPERRDLLPAWIGKRLTMQLESTPRDRASAREGRLVDTPRPPHDADLIEHSVRMLWHQSEALAFGVELRHPFFDRRLVEFMLAVPAAHKMRGGRPKAILRSVLEKRMSPRHAPANASRGGPDRRALRSRIRAIEQRRWDACFAKAVCADLGYVDLEQLSRGFARYQAGEAGLKYSLARTYRMELWLRRLFGGQ
jgi:asparagine synthase (glutamine-hydrolysing)